jgi:hypothetical protein
MGRWVGGLVSALFAAVGALISTREGASGRYEGAAPAALDQLFNPTLGAVRPLPTASPGLGRETAEAVGAGFLSGQTTADRGENPPHHDQHDNDDEDPLHPQTSPRERGPSIRQRKKFLILNSQFWIVVPMPLPEKVAVGRSGISVSGSQFLLAWMRLTVIQNS